MKHWILLLSVTMMSAGFFVLTLTQQDENQDQANTTIKTQTKKDISNKLVTIDNQKPTAKRSLAAVSPAIVQKDDFVYLGVDKKDLDKFPLTNKESSNWEEKFTKSFKTNLVGVQSGSFQVKKQRSIIKKVNKSSRIFQHVIVRYRNALGNPYSFEALIDAETGSMVQSWNRTRYEKRLPIALDGTNRFLRKTQ